MSDNNNKQVIITGPRKPVTFSIYKITIGEYVYIGHTQDIFDRAHRHATDVGRKVFDAFAAQSGPMIVEHVTGANTRQEARIIERILIKSEYQRVGSNLLNVHHRN